MRQDSPRHSPLLLASALAVAAVAWPANDAQAHGHGDTCEVTSTTDGHDAAGQPLGFQLAGFPQASGTLRYCLEKASGTGPLNQPLIVVIPSSLGPTLIIDSAFYGPITPRIDSMVVGAYPAFVPGSVTTLDLTPSGGSHFNVQNADLSLSHLKITGASSGAIVSESPEGGRALTGDISVDLCLFQDNENDKAGYGQGGGAIRMRRGGGGSLSVTSSTFVNNISLEAGGALYLESVGQTTIENAYVADNGATTSGGFARITGGQTYVRNVTFHHNRVNHYGAAIYLANGDLDMAYVSATSHWIQAYTAPEDDPFEVRFGTPFYFTGSVNATIHASLIHSNHFAGGLVGAGIWVNFITNPIPDVYVTETILDRESVGWGPGLTLDATTSALLRPIGTDTPPILAAMPFTIPGAAVAVLSQWSSAFDLVSGACIARDQRGESRAESCSAGPYEPEIDR